MSRQRRFSRRGLMIGGTGGLVTAMGLGAGPARAQSSTLRNATAAPSVTPRDSRYPELVVGNNQRFVGAPGEVRLAARPEQVLAVVQEAVAARKRLTVRSGGHCYADFVSNPETDVILDLSGLNRCEYDPSHRAFRVEPGAQLGNVYEQLYRSHGVTVPGGVCPTVGVGGHAAGGGFGLLSRRFGLVADYVDAVEMVVVGRDGASLVTAGRHSTDPALQDLWWATTGGGGGSFGIVTTYWFRDPAAAASAAPETVLPRPPAQVLMSSVPIPWSVLTREKLGRLLGNYASWHVENADAPEYLGLSSVLFVRHRSAGGVGLLAQVDASEPDASGLLADFLAGITEGVGVEGPFPARPLPWLASTKAPAVASPALLYDPSMRSAVKSAYLRKGFTAAQVDTIYASMTRADYTNPNATLQLAGAGGRINDLKADARAYAHRDSVIFALFENFWAKPTEDATHIDWLRTLFHGVFAETGGYPAPGEQTDGCYINNPDTDIVDDRFNRSGVPWPTLYWGGNYRRLQRAKHRWDPTDFFRHSQSVRLPS